MQKIKVKNHTLEVYDAIDEMPVVRYHKFTQLMVLAAGVGNDLDAVRTKIMGIRQMIEDGHVEKAKVEVLNLYQTFAFIDKVVDPKSLAFACAVKSIDGKDVDCRSTAELQKVADKLNEWMTKQQRDGVGRHPGILGWIKKKLEDDLAYYYPEHIDRDGEGLALMKAMLLRRIQRIVDNEDLEKKDAELERLGKRMRERNEVTDYSQYEKESDRAFEQGCMSITGELGKDAKAMTVMEYHAATRVLEERAEAMEKARKK